MTRRMAALGVGEREAFRNRLAPRLQTGEPCWRRRALSFFSRNWMAPRSVLKRNFRRAAQRGWSDAPNCDDLRSASSGADDCRLDNGAALGASGGAARMTA